MTTSAYLALRDPTARAIALVRTLHCKPPTFKPEAPVSGHIACPKCKSRLNFRVTAQGQTYGRCVAADCIRWDFQ
ncbi:MAG: hypothetical protein WC322_00325 [Candidatus Paceibacterota bacterium]|jgi:hypothetical protein